MANRHTLRLAVLQILCTLCFASQAQTPPPSPPANIEACRACHGPLGVSINPAIPNLAGQKPAYLEAQLKSFRSKDRKNDFMNVIAGQLSDSEIHAFAAYWSGMAAQPSAEPGSHAPAGAAIHSRMELPRNFPAGFTVYQTEVEDGVLTKRYANLKATEAARRGARLPDGSVIISVNYQAQKDAAGKDIAGPVQSYAGMESRGNWGKDIPVLLRNENWDYALFAADGARRDELNQAQCLACHKPKESDSYVFTLKQLREAPAT
jgi:cytochrome c553